MNNKIEHIKEEIKSDERNKELYLLVKRDCDSAYIVISWYIGAKMVNLKTLEDMEDYTCFSFGYDEEHINLGAQTSEYFFEHLLSHDWNVTTDSIKGFRILGNSEVF
jgi:hypothetical protein